jgi:hypothetical protein
VDQVDPQARGLPRGNKPPATAAATDGRTGTSKPVSNVNFRIGMGNGELNAL